jgi:hypothetical protein
MNRISSLKPDPRGRWSTVCVWTGVGLVAWVHARHGMCIWASGPSRVGSSNQVVSEVESFDGAQALVAHGWWWLTAAGWGAAVECFAADAVAAAPPQVLVVVVGQHMVTGDAAALTQRLHAMAEAAGAWVEMGQVVPEASMALHLTLPTTPNNASFVQRMMEHATPSRTLTAGDCGIEVAAAAAATVVR